MMIARIFTKEPDEPHFMLRSGETMFSPCGHIENNSDEAIFIVLKAVPE